MDAVGLLRKGSAPVPGIVLGVLCVLLGALCGAVLLKLLILLADGLTEGKSIPIWTVPAQLLALAVFFVPVALLVKYDVLTTWHLIVEAIATVVVLMGGAVARFMRLTRRGKTSAPSGSDGDSK